MYCLSDQLSSSKIISFKTVANTGVLVNSKIKVKPTDENILHVLSLRSTVILKDNIIQVFQFYHSSFPVLYLRHYHNQAAVQ